MRLYNQQVTLDILLDNSSPCTRNHTTHEGVQVSLNDSKCFISPPELSLGFFSAKVSSFLSSLHVSVFRCVESIGHGLQLRVLCVRQKGSAVVDLQSKLFVQEVWINMLQLLQVSQDSTRCSTHSGKLFHDGNCILIGSVVNSTIDPFDPCQNSEAVFFLEDLCRVITLGCSLQAKVTQLLNQLIICHAIKLSSFFCQALRLEVRLLVGENLGSSGAAEFTYSSIYSTTDPILGSSTSSK